MEASAPPLYPSVSQSENDQKGLLKLKSENLFIRLEQIEKDFKRYNKLKHRWNTFKNILHYSKYPLAVILGGLDIALIFTIIGIPLEVVGATITIGEVIGTNILEDTYINIKVNKYNKKCKHIKEWIDKMYIFKDDVLKDNIIDNKEIQQWKQLLEEYEKETITLSSDKVITSSNEKEINSLPDLVKLQEMIQAIINKKPNV